jgi:hypothetical protein
MESAYDEVSILLARESFVKGLSTLTQPALPRATTFHNRLRNLPTHPPLTLHYRQPLTSTIHQLTTRPCQQTP